MSCWSAERKPWLILGKTIWAGVWGQEVEGHRGERRLKKDEVPEEEEEEEEGKCKKKQILLERPVFVDWAPAPLHIGERNPHFSSTEVVCFGCLGLYFGARDRNYHLGGARVPQCPRSPRKNGNFSSPAKALSSLSSSSCLLLNQTPGAAHTDTSFVQPSELGLIYWPCAFQGMLYSPCVHWY